MNEPDASLGRHDIPGLQVKSRNPGKLVGIVGDERDVVGDCDGGDHQVVSADWRTVLFQLAPNPSVGFGSGIVKRQGIELGKEPDELLGGALAVLALVRAALEARCGLALYFYS